MTPPDKWTSLGYKFVVWLACVVGAWVLLSLLLGWI